jgi:hypothetical protein
MIGSDLISIDPRAEYPVHEEITYLHGDGDGY